jgi:hypothetical protein
VVAQPVSIFMQYLLRLSPNSCIPRIANIITVSTSKAIESNTRGREANSVLTIILSELILVIVRKGLNTRMARRECTLNPENYMATNDKKLVNTTEKSSMFQ